jgi:hypothetical protein
LVPDYPGGFYDDITEAIADLNCLRPAQPAAAAESASRPADHIGSS